MVDLSLSTLSCSGSVIWVFSRIWETSCSSPCVFLGFTTQILPPVSPLFGLAQTPGLGDSSWLCCYSSPVSNSDSSWWLTLNLWGSGAKDPAWTQKWEERFDRSRHMKLVCLSRSGIVQVRSNSFLHSVLNSSSCKAGPSPGLNMLGTFFPLMVQKLCRSSPEAEFCLRAEGEEDTWYTLVVKARDMLDLCKTY